MRITKQKCEQCKLNFPDAMAKNVHNLKEHSFKCNMCSEKFSGKKYMDAHVLNFHAKKSQREGMQCISCEYKTETEGELTKHYEIKHISTEKQHQCNKCKAAFTDKKELDNHVKRVHVVKHNEKKMKCIVCDYRGTSEAELTKHYEKEHVKISENPNKTGSNGETKKVKCKNGPLCRYKKGRSLQLPASGGGAASLEESSSKEQGSKAPATSGEN